LISRYAKDARQPVNDRGGVILMTQSDSLDAAPPSARREITRFASDFPFDAADRERLTAALGVERTLFAYSHENLLEMVREHPEVDVLCPLSFSTIDDLLALVPHLRWLALSSAGAEHVTSQTWASEPSAPIITTASGVHAVPISEHAFSAILLWSRRWPDLLRLQSEHAWPNTLFEKAALAGRELEDATLLILGLGAIGRRIARLGRAFGMRVVGVRRSAMSGASDPDVDQLASIDGLDTLLPDADYVVISAPSTAETQGLVSAERLALMKPTTMLINIARGEIVDESALISALTSGKLGAAALDVTAGEPLPSDDPLWSTPNVFISPHVSGFTPRYSNRLTDILLDNFARYRAGQQLRNLVQPARGY
jgi:phosphoglycerate dehydrogenase-like enzyme